MIVNSWLSFLASSGLRYCGFKFCYERLLLLVSLAVSFIFFRLSNSCLNSKTSASKLGVVFERWTIGFVVGVTSSSDSTTLDKLLFFYIYYLINEKKETTTRAV